MPPKKNKKPKKKVDTTIVIKPCPGCGAFIEKSGGCNHIKCKNITIRHGKVRCGTEWCWVCERVKGDDEKTQCNDKSHKSH